MEWKSLFLNLIVWLLVCCSVGLQPTGDLNVSNKINEKNKIKISCFPLIQLKIINDWSYMFKKTETTPCDSCFQKTYSEEPL
jgi:hypothetical protein